MRVGLISDTHDHVLRIREATAILNRAGVEAILHAGDYCSPFAVRELARLEAPLHGILGINDGDVFQIQRAFAEIGARLGISELMSRRHLSDARRALRAMLGGELPRLEMDHD